MVRTITLATVVLLVAGAAASADLLQGQNWNLGLAATLNSTSGSGDLDTIGHLGADYDQSINDDAYDTSAHESVTVGFFHMANTHSHGAAILATASLQTIGANPATTTLGPGQEQSVEDSAGDVEQFQGLDLLGTQSLSTEGGRGRADSLNVFNLSAGQGAGNLGGGSGQGVCLNGSQDTEVRGANAASDYSADNELAVGASSEIGDLFQYQTTSALGSATQEEMYGVMATQELEGTGDGEAESTTRMSLGMGQGLHNVAPVGAHQSASLSVCQNSEIEGRNSASSGSVTTTIIGGVYQLQVSGDLTAIP